MVSCDVEVGFALLVAASSSLDSLLLLSVSLRVSIHRPQWILLLGLFYCSLSTGSAAYDVFSDKVVFSAPSG